MELTRSSVSTRLLLTRQTAPILLLDTGLVSAEEFVDVGLRVLQQSRRNRNFAVVLATGKGFFLKQADPGSLEAAQRSERERFVYELSETSPGLRSCLPKPYLYDDVQKILVQELIAPATPLDIHHLRLGKFSTSLAQSLGATLARLHSELGKAYRFGNSALKLPGHLPTAFSISRFQPDRIEGAQARVLHMIRSAPECDTLLDEARSAWHVNTLMHGDLKLGNCLVVGDRNDTEPVICIIDWETADGGDAAWDLAGLLQSYLALWIRSMPAGGGVALEHAIAEAAIPSANLVLAATHLWRGYNTVLGLGEAMGGPLVGRAVRFAGARLLQTAFEQASGTPEVTGHTVLTIQLALNMLARPGEARSELLGLA